MDREYSTPFIDSTKEMLSTMVGVLCDERESFSMSGDLISGTIFFHGESNGQISLVFPLETARTIVSSMLGMDEGEMDEDTLRDGVGEMANIVAGNVKAALSATPYKFLMSLPKIQAGPLALPEGASGNETWMSSSLGDFCLVYWLATAG